jgi:hypothetical protein
MKIGLRFSVLAGVSLAVAGCGSSSEHTPTERVETAPASLAAAPVVKRTISRRNPFGDVAATTNLALDGDFELTQSSFSSAWYGLSGDLQSFEPFAWATGGRCRSGIACGVVPAGQAILDFDVAVRPLTENVLRFVAKPAGACADVTGEIDLVVVADGSVIDSFKTSPETAAPGPDGWCTYSVGVSAERPSYQGAELVISSASDALVDDVVFAESPGAGHGARRDGDPVRGRHHAALRKIVRDARDRAAAGIVGRSGPFGLRRSHG